MLRLNLLVYFAILLAVTRPQPITDADNFAEYFNNQEEKIPIKQEENVQSFMDEHAEVIRKIISEQEFAVTDSAQRQEEREPTNNNNEQTTTTNRNDQKTEELDTETKAKCKHYFELFQQKYKELQNHGNRYKEIGAVEEQNVAQTNKYDVKVNNYDMQNLPYPERQLFSNSRGPIDYNTHQEQMKLSPMTLQNTLLSDGKMVYFWYKTPIPNYQVYLPPNLPIANNNEKDVYQEIPTTSTTSTTTTEATTTTTTTTETVTTEKPKEPIENFYQHQLKFVFPIQYPKPNVVDIPSYNIDPYAYYPREFQPDFMNVQMPYVPTFHMIKQLTVPNKYNADASMNNLGTSS